MEYRQLDSEKVSLLGFGCMRFPCTEDGKIDEKEATIMLDTARLAGVNYFDTAYPYHNQESEPFVGRYLSKLNRDDFYLATKLPCWLIHSVEDVKEIFQKQLERLQTSYFDFYLMHALHKQRWEDMEAIGVYDYLLELKKEGKIKHLGFSFHDDYDVFEKIITSKKWDFCQIQYNYMDTHEQAGDKGYKLAEQLGVPMVIMEPIKGGSLAQLPADVSEPFTKIDPKASHSSWALRWVGSHSNVKVILSGMSTLEHVKDNLATFSPFIKLSTNEEAAIVEVTKQMNARINNGCTGCNYCMPCPAGVNIPRNFKIWNNYGVYQNKNQTIQRWKEIQEESQSAIQCVSCGKCETVCPQHLPIREDLKKLRIEIDGLTNHA